MYICMKVKTKYTAAEHIHTYSSRAHTYSSRAHTVHTYSSRAHTYSSRAHTYSSRAHTYSSRAHTYSSRAHMYSSRAHTYSSRAHIYIRTYCIRKYICTYVHTYLISAWRSRRCECLRIQHKIKQTPATDDATARSITSTIHGQF